MKQCAPKKIRGVALMTAMFILLILSLAATVSVRLAMDLSNISTFTIKQLQAYYAALAGIEWSNQNARRLNGCPTGGNILYEELGSFYPNPSNPSVISYTANGQIKNTRATTYCTEISNVTEGSETVKLLEIISLGQTISGNFEPYARRVLSAKLVIRCTGC